MRKAIALIFAACLLLTLAACGAEQTAETGTTPITTAGAEPETTVAAETTEMTEATEATVETTAPVETTVPTTEPTPAPTQSAHSHSYSSKVTKTATCTEKGVETFTCSCGKSYTKEIKATGHSYRVTDSKPATCLEDGHTKYTCTCGDTYTKTLAAAGSHSMNGWKYFGGGNYTSGVRKNSCANCDYFEEEKTYGTMFNHYAEIVKWLPAFSNPQQLQNMEKLGDVITAAFFNNITHETVFDQDNGVYTHTIAVSDMNAFTSQCLGMNYDYTGIDGLWVLFESKCYYDAETDALLIKAYGAGDRTNSIEGVDYTTEDDVHFTVTVHWLAPDDTTFDSTFKVELIGSHYVIVEN